jgi:hypothetical protein
MKPLKAAVEKDDCDEAKIVWALFVADKAKRKMARLSL